MKKQKHQTVLRAPPRFIERSTQQNSINMKFFFAIVILALAGIALAENKPEEIESAKGLQGEQVRDKRGLLVGAAYTAPLAYSAYTAPAVAAAPLAAPLAYNALPYAYSAYPYYSSAYSAPYIVG